MMYDYVPTTTRLPRSPPGRDGDTDPPPQTNIALAARIRFQLQQPVAAYASEGAYVLCSLPLGPEPEGRHGSLETKLTTCLRRS